MFVLVAVVVVVVAAVVVWWRRKKAPILTENSTRDEGHTPQAQAATAF